MKLTVSQLQQTFLVGDYFAVYEGESDYPQVYEWKSLKSYNEQADCFSFSFPNNTFVVPKMVFSDSKQLIRFRTIAEGQLTNCSSVVKRIQSRIIPPKYNYRTCEIPEKSYSASGTYVERDINSGSVALMYGKLGLFIWLSAAVIAVLVFFLLSGLVGNVSENLIYFVPISLFSGIGVALVFYLMCCIAAKYRYSTFVKKDVSTVEPLVFVVAPGGFAIIEQCVYSGNELIPWSTASFFFETKYTIIIYCKDKSVCRIPKRLFPKNIQNDISSFIAGKVVQS